MNVGCTTFMRSKLFALMTTLNAHMFAAKRIPAEEAFLCDETQTGKVAKEYKNYMDKVPWRLFPLIY